jgi:hypothetical protein
MDHVRDHFSFAAVDIAQTPSAPPPLVEDFRLERAVVAFHAPVRQAQGDARIQESQLAQARSQDIVFIF